MLVLYCAGLRQCMQHQSFWHRPSCPTTFAMVFFLVYIFSTFMIISYRILKYCSHLFHPVHFKQTNVHFHYQLKSPIFVKVTINPLSGFPLSCFSFHLPNGTSDLSKGAILSPIYCYHSTCLNATANQPLNLVILDWPWSATRYPNC